MPARVIQEASHTTIAVLPTREPITPARKASPGWETTPATASSAAAMPFACSPASSRAAATTPCRRLASPAVVLAHARRRGQTIIAASARISADRSGMTPSAMTDTSARAAGLPLICTAKALTSTPGSGIQNPARKTASAASVMPMRRTRSELREGAARSVIAAMIAHAGTTPKRARCVTPSRTRAGRSCRRASGDSRRRTSPRACPPAPWPSRPCRL